LQAKRFWLPFQSLPFLLLFLFRCRLWYLKLL